MDMYKNIKHSCTFVDIRYLYVMDSLLCVFIYAHLNINSNGWLRHLIGSVNCDVTGPLRRHQKAVSCLGWDKSISDTRRLSRTAGCTRQIDLRHPALVSYTRVYETPQSYTISSIYWTKVEEWRFACVDAIVLLVVGNTVSGQWSMSPVALLTNMD